MNLGEQLAKVQQDLQIEKLKAEDRNPDLIRSLEEQEAEILKNMDAVANGQAVTSTPVEIAEPALPYDFNAAFGHPNANAIIISLIKSAQAQLQEAYEKEITALKEDHKHELNAENLRYEEMKQLSDRIKADSHANTEKMHELLYEIRDLESKRDAAAQQLEEANAQIAAMEADNAALKFRIDELHKKLDEKTPAPKFTVPSTTDLAELLKRPLQNSAEETRTDIPQSTIYAELLPQVEPFPASDSLPVDKESSSVVDATTEDKVRVLEEKVADVNRRLAILEAASLIVNP